MHNSKQPILVVEDSAEDFETTIRTFRKSGLHNPVYHCVDGDDALDYLYRRGEYSAEKSAPRPGIILLDLNLPGTDGREVLSVVKNDQNLKSIPIIVLTTSSYEDDIAGCYQSGANSYVQKPVDLQGFVEAVALIKSFWFELVLMPENS